MNVFTPAAYTAVRKPLADASTLPPHVYSSPEWYDREVELIFKKNWLMAAREEDVPNPGDYVRVDFFNEPLIIIRGRDGVVRTLSASCRHRGAELVSGSGNCAALVCPYHGWTYSLAGQLLAAPLMNGVQHFKESECRLPSVRTELWGGFICINFDRDAPTLIESLGGLVERLKSYRMDEMRVVRKWTNKVKCNWKIWAENSREAYHLGTVHRPSLQRFRPNGYTLRPFSAEIVPKKYAINSGPLDLSFGIAEKPTIPFHESISEHDRNHAHYVLAYPHIIVNMQPDKMIYHQIFPEGPEQITIIYGVCFPRSTIERGDFATAVEGYYPAAEMGLREDIGICEAQQRGLRGQLAAPGRLSPQEEPTVHALAEYVLDCVLDDEPVKLRGNA